MTLLVFAREKGLATFIADAIRPQILLQRRIPRIEGRMERKVLVEHILFGVTQVIATRLYALCARWSVKQSQESCRSFAAKRVAQV